MCVLSVAVFMSSPRVLLIDCSALAQHVRYLSSADLVCERLWHRCACFLFAVALYEADSEAERKEDKTLWLNLCVLISCVPGFAVDRRTLNTQILDNSGL